MAVAEVWGRTQGRVRFGPFEVDFDLREIRRHGTRLNLQEKPFRILQILIEAGGGLVTRKQLIAELWPDTYVNFNRSLNTAIYVLRQTLSDSPRKPRFLETRMGLGYRFIAPIEWISEASHPADDSAMIDSIAVLPFENVQRDPELEYLARGIPETLIRNLSAIEGLRVVSRSASFRHLSARSDACAAARDLKAATVVCGSVVSRHGRIAINVELADVATGLQLWGELYQCAVGDLLDIEDRISQEIAAKLRSRLSREEKAILSKAYTGNPEAHEFYLRGQFYANKMTEQALAMSVAQFEAALRIDPDYALAHTGLANVHSLYAFLNVLPARQVLPKAKEHALQALRIDDELPEAHTALAGVMKTYEWNWAAAELHYRRALQLNPNYAAGHRFYADYLSASGRHQEACREMELARRLDPLSLIINMELAWIRYMARDYAGAVELAQQALDLEPLFAPSLHALGLAYQQLGRTTAAIDALLNACALSQRHPAALAALANAYAAAGHTMRAQEIFLELQALSSYRYASPYGLALASLAVEMKDTAIAFLETACADRDVWLAWLKVEPRWDPLRHDPRFQKLVARIGLSDKP